MISLVANINVNPKKGILGGINNALIISVYKENDDNGNYWEWGSADSGTYTTSASLLKALNKIDSVKIYPAISEAYSRLRDIIDFNKYQVKISIFTRFLQSVMTDGGHPTSSLRKESTSKQYDNIMPIQMPAASRSNDLNVCCAVEFHVKPIKEDGKIVKSFKNFFN